MDRSKSPEEILPDPIALTKKNAGLFNPPLPLPQNLYGSARKNSTGLDFGNLAQLTDLQKNITPVATAAVPDATSKDLDSALATAQKAFPAWAGTPVHHRATLLESAADVLETHRDELVSLCVFEAKKTLPDSIAELREAADYCRYYAAEARRIFTPQTLTGPVGESNVLSLHSRGVFVAISPWNFPLAIFIGQIAAALVTGNCVIAKPAEQTPRIAQRAVAYFTKRAFPKMLHLICGPGETTGAALIPDTRIAGVVFTGGTDTAKTINRQLAGRMPIIPLIAETGGQNCMVVDSSSLPEQVVDDIILSAFGSAGQRCSSLRIVFVQEEIADELLELLAGAMKELKLGDPSDPATDIGSVTSMQAAQKSLLAHIEDMKKSAKLLAASMPPPAGCFVAPHVFEIKSISELKAEHFGPILHVIRFKAGTLSHVAASINSTGYGLTCGIHSRIDAHVRELVSVVRAGNLYVNRSMIGATVGVQPFGGESLSGTGPKAGGPHYLQRFCLERTVTVNTAAIGGNAALLSGEDQ